MVAAVQGEWCHWWMGAEEGGGRGKNKKRKENGAVIHELK